MTGCPVCGDEAETQTAKGQTVWQCENCGRFLTSADGLEALRKRHGEVDPATISATLRARESSAGGEVVLDGRAVDDLLADAGAQSGTG